MDKIQDRPFSVYLVTNTVTEKFYVGKTGNTVRDRWTDHKSNARRNANGYLYRSMRKYGEGVFEIKTLAEFATEAEANNAERLWIILLNSHKQEQGYNLTLGGDGVRHNDATKEKLRIAKKGFKHSQETKDKLSILVTGRKHTPETLLKMSKAQTGRVTSEATKKKQSEVRKGRFGGDKHPMWGKHIDPAHAEKLKQINSGHPSWNKGISMAEETRKKLSDINTERMKDKNLRNDLSEASKNLWADPGYRARMKVSQDARYARKRAELAV